MAIALKKRKEISSFYESFSDLLFCTLVLFLVIVVGLIVQIGAETFKTKSKRDELDRKIVEAELRLGELEKKEGEFTFAVGQLNIERKRMTAENEELEISKRNLGQDVIRFGVEKEKIIKDMERLKKAMAAFVGLKGEMKNIVILLDLSGSMVGTPQLERRFDQLRSEISNLITHLDFETFTVIGFGGDDASGVRIERISQTLIGNDETSRQTGVDAVTKWKAIGGTPTLSALKVAFSLKEVDTIILYTDGQPFAENGSQILDRFGQQPVLDFLRKNNASGNIAINTIAIGAYDQNSNDNPGDAGLSFGDFLRLIASENNGEFIGK